MRKRAKIATRRVVVVGAENKGRSTGQARNILKYRTFFVKGGTGNWEKEIGCVAT